MPATTIPLLLLTGLLTTACASPETPPRTASVCLSSGAHKVALPANRFTLSWTHSIEQILWDEDWRLDAGTLVLVEARVRGSGAGMEPASGAQLIDGVWHYSVARREAALVLTHSPYTAGYTLCAAGRCQPLTAWLPDMPAIAQIRVHACDQ